MATKNFIEELEWRGMIHTIMPGAKEQLEKEMTTAYLGIDPTADSLHIGHLVGVMILKHFQMCGHRPLALIGGATGMIGDPSGKSQERNLLDEPTLRHNQEAIKRQLAKLLDFESDAPNAAVLVNNYDWMKDISFLEFIRDIGKCITVNYMMAKDSVKKRFSGEGDGMSFTEFTYQLVQGFDFLHLYQTMNCKVQLGGADQWGNITTGTELIRRKAGGEDGGKLLCRPRGDVRQAACGQGHAGVVPHRDGKAAEGAREHHQRLCACQRAVERKAAVGIALENVGPLHAGVIVLRGGEQRLRGLAARERRRLHGQRAERQHQCEQQRHKSFLEFHHVTSPLDAWIV